MSDNYKTALGMWVSVTFSIRKWVPDKNAFVDTNQTVEGILKADVEGTDARLVVCNTHEGKTVMFTVPASRVVAVNILNRTPDDYGLPVPLVGVPA